MKVMLKGRVEGEYKDINFIDFVLLFAYYSFHMLLPRDLVFMNRVTRC